MWCRISKGKQGRSFPLVQEAGFVQEATWPSLRSPFSFIIFFSPTGNQLAKNKRKSYIYKN